MKTEFLLKVQDTTTFKKDDGVKDLESKQERMMYGIHVAVEQQEPYIFKIITRSHFPKYAIKDRNFLGSHLDRTYGKLLDVTTYALTMTRGKQESTPYKIEDGMLQPASQWSNLQKFHLGRDFGIHEKGVFVIE